jgi:hypothetical protein
MISHQGDSSGLIGLVEATKDGRTWRIGTATEVAWIANATTVSRTITAAIPPVFEAYATYHELFDEPSPVAVQERAVVQHLSDWSSDQPWWLGFLDTGAHDVVFDHAPKVTLYEGWRYVLVEAGPTQTLTWRTGHMRAQNGALPDLFFPADRTWLISALWDDTWTCIGGPAQLITALQRDPRVQARPVQLSEDATPPGHHDL